MLITIALTPRATRKISWSRVAAFATVALFLLAIWQSVKVDYRGYLNQGTRLQEVRVTHAQRFSRLISLVNELEFEQLGDGLVAGFDRLGYTFYFAHSIDNVPARVPHQNGGLWLGAIKHVLMPRAFFPNKPAIHDSARTNKFSGVRVAGAKQGASISIGYVGESYIDFGSYAMFFPIFLLGIAYGFTQKWFVNRRGSPLLGMATSGSLLLFNAMFLETSNIKIVGSLVAGVLVLQVLCWIFGDRYWQYVCNAARRQR